MKTFKELLNDTLNEEKWWDDIRWASGNGITVDVLGKNIKVVVKQVHKKARKVEVVDSNGVSIMVDVKQVKESVDLDEAKGQNMLWDLIDQRKLGKLMGNMDEQSKKLISQILDILQNSLTLPDRQGQAFNRLSNLVQSKQNNEGMLRNQVFKIANELGIKLPSSSF